VWYRSHVGHEDLRRYKLVAVPGMYLLEVVVAKAAVLCLGPFSLRVCGTPFVYFFVVRAA
jgi:hypothetical protein